MIPSLAQLGRSTEGLFVIEDVHNFGTDYDRTLMAWYENFGKSWDDIKSRHSSGFQNVEILPALLGGDIQGKNQPVMADRSDRPVSNIKIRVSMDPQFMVNDSGCNIL